MVVGGGLRASNRSDSYRSGIQQAVPTMRRRRRDRTRRPLFLRCVRRGMGCGWSRPRGLHNDASTILGNRALVAVTMIQTTHRSRRNASARRNALGELAVSARRGLDPFQWRSGRAITMNMKLLILLQLLSMVSTFHAPHAIPTGLFHNTRPQLPRYAHADDADLFDAQELDRRLQTMRAHFLDQEYQRPPNPAFTHLEFVTEVLKSLWNNDDPYPDSGVRLLLRVSTQRWRRKIWESVGAPHNETEEAVATALAEAMCRPTNQFGILVGEGEEYVVAFPSEPIDYGDGKCWVECQLRGKKDHTLYAITGWTLERRVSDGAWLVDVIDWQDFRDAFRPGIGREEWLRICG